MLTVVTGTSPCMSAGPVGSTSFQVLDELRSTMNSHSYMDRYICCMELYETVHFNGTRPKEIKFII
jgi:hypothetical protein